MTRDTPRRRKSLTSKSKTREREKERERERERERETQIQLIQTIERGTGTGASHQPREYRTRWGSVVLRRTRSACWWTRPVEKSFSILCRNCTFARRHVQLLLRAICNDARNDAARASLNKKLANYVRGLPAIARGRNLSFAVYRALVTRWSWIDRLWKFSNFNKVFAKIFATSLVRCNVSGN